MENINFYKQQVFDCNSKQDCWRMINNFEKREFQETQNSFLRLPGALSGVEIGGERGSKITNKSEEERRTIRRLFRQGGGGSR